VNVLVVGGTRGLLPLPRIARGDAADFIVASLAAPDIVRQAVQLAG
jgi:hypothetical protein